MYNFKKVKIINLIKRSGTYGEISEVKVVDENSQTSSILKLMGKYKINDILFIPILEN